MAKLSDRIENVLNEARMLLLGGQVLLGFSYRIFFEPGFDRITEPARLAQLSAVGIMTAGLGLRHFTKSRSKGVRQPRLKSSLPAFLIGRCSH